VITSIRLFCLVFIFLIAYNSDEPVDHLRQKEDAMPKTPVPNDALRRARIEHGWTQRHLAEQIGTNHFTVARWEAGTAFPSPYFRRKLSAIFASPPDALGFGTTDAASVAVPSDAAALPDPSLLGSARPPWELLPQHLVGRETDLATLQQMLGARRAVALSGLPGVGKTTLALAITQERACHQQFVDGVLWAGLGPAPDLFAALGRWAVALGMAPNELRAIPSVDALGKRVHALIGEQRLVLVIDDAWHIADALALQIGGPRCAHLLTTRFPSLATQFTHEHPVVIEALSATQGLDLLRALAPELVATSTEQSQALIDAVGGLPLALTLIGHYLHRQSFGQHHRLRRALEVVQDERARMRLNEPMNPIERPPAFPADLPLSLEASIRLSVASLAPTTQELLAALAWFPAKPHSFSEAAAAAVYGREVDEFVEQIDLLLDAGLVDCPAPERMSLHQTITAYTRIHAASPPSQERMVAYFSEYVCLHQDEDAALEQELPNVLQALEYAHQGRHETALVPMTLRLAPFLQRRGLYRVAAQWLTQAKRTVQAIPDLALVQQCCVHLGNVLHVLGEEAQALVVVQEGLASATEDADYLCRLYLLQGRILRGQGKLSEAQTTWQLALTLARQGNDHRLVADCLSVLGMLSTRLGNPVEALVLLTEALPLAQEVHDDELVIRIERDLGIVAGNAGHYDQAAHHFQASLERARYLNHQTLIGQNLTNLGIVAMNQGDLAAGERYFREALDITKAIGHAHSLANILANLAWSAYEQQAYDQANDYAREGLAIARATEDADSLCVLLLRIGEIATKQGEWAQAQAAFTEGATIAQSMGHSWYSVNFLIEQGELDLAQRQGQQADATFGVALERAQDLGNQELIGRALFGRAKAAHIQRQQEMALRYGQDSVQVFAAIQHAMVQEVQQWCETVIGNHRVASDPLSNL
jgi:tetratricopeptide (TPR) repeat protein/transcriptional regulator with XRE-family HTH domain